MTPTEQRIARGEKDQSKQMKNEDGCVGSSDSAIQALPAAEDHSHENNVNEGPHKCNICSNSYSSKNKLFKHLRKMHYNGDFAMPSSKTTQNKAGGAGSSGAAHHMSEQNKEHKTTMSERNRWSTLKMIPRMDRLLIRQLSMTFQENMPLLLRRSCIWYSTELELREKIY